MSTISAELLILLLLILANGLFTMSEMAVVSARKARLRQQADGGNAGAAAALSLAESPDEFLPTVQVGITLIGTLTGALGGATIADELAAWFRGFSWAAPHAEAAGIGLVVVSISFATLLIGELVPKRVALSSPERIAAGLAPTLRLLSRTAAPAVRFLSWSSGLVLRLLPARFRKVEEDAVTEEEIKVMIEEGTKAGTVDETEQEMVEGVFRLGDRRVTELMTPRQKIVWLDSAATAEEIRAALAGTPFSRYPVGEGSLDRARGFVHVKDLLNLTLSGKGLDITGCIRTPIFVPETTPALRVLEMLQDARVHLALVVDEHGGIEGLATMADMLRAVVGDLPSAQLPDAPRAVQREDGSWLVDGVLPTYEFKESLGIDRLPAEDEGGFTTVGGFVMAHLGRVPAVADRFDCDGWSYEVVDMDGNRVDKVLVARSGDAV